MDENSSEVYVCTYRAARNMAFQNITQPRGSIRQLAEVEGSSLIGTKIRAPFGVQEEVYVLPMDNVLPTKVRFTAFTTLLFHPALPTSTYGILSM